MTRIRRRRTKGWRWPDGAVYVGRPSRWGNPYRPGHSLHGRVTVDKADAVGRFNEWIAKRGQSQLRREIREALAGKDLVCWCPEDMPCHADTLIEIANPS